MITKVKERCVVIKKEEQKNEDRKRREERKEEKRKEKVRKGVKTIGEER